MQFQRAHKYNAKATVVDGIRFPSRKEANRYSELKLMERAGLLTDLETQVRYALEVNGILIAHYVADFRYWLVDEKRRVVEDSKGFLTDVYRLKKKLMLALYGIEVEES